jgi:hypothetical protein
MRTEFGRIAKLLVEARATQTPCAAPAASAGARAANYSSV